MTLRSYQYDPTDYHGKPTGNVVVHSRWRRFRERVTPKRVFLTILVLAIAFGAWVGGDFLYNAHKLFGGNIFGIFSTTKLKGESTGRVNILLAGNSADDPGHGGANLTDSIMLLSIDTKNNKAFMMSIPRDLWVHIPGYGYQKINDAYVVGKTNNFSAPGYPNGGMGELEQVVSQDFGVPIDYYALIDYAAIRDAVNDVGGINIDIQSCDSRGLYDPNRDYATGGPLVNLSNGWHHLDGEQALDLARARGDPSPYGIAYGFCASDFTRTANQRKMLVALKSKATGIGVLANPAKLSSLFNTVGNHVKTDLNLSDIHRLYDLTKNIKSSNIQSLALDNANGQNLLASYSAPDGESALIPATGINDYSAIQAYIRQLVSSNPVVQENANIVILNGTSKNGLAANVKQQLTLDQMDVTAIGDAPNPQTRTVIIDESSGKKPATKAALIKLFGNNVTTSTQALNGLNYNADFVIILGSDQANTGTAGTTPSG